MSHHIDSIPFSGIIRIRDMMYGVANPYRLDQGDVSFDAPGSVKSAMVRAIAENRSHYLQTAGVPRLQELAAEKIRRKNGVPVGSPDEVLVTNGGIHALYLHEDRAWRLDAGELEARVTPKTKAIYLNSPQNPTGGVLTPADLQAVADIARRHGLWVVSDEAYEDVVYGVEQASIAALDGMYARTIPVYTFSKSYAMTGLRLGYLAVADGVLRDRVRKLLFFTASNVSSVVQYGGIGGLEGPQEIIAEYQRELHARRDLFYRGIAGLGGILTGQPPDGAFYAFLRFDPDWRRRATKPLPAASGGHASESWAITEYLISQGRIGCIPGGDFGPGGEGYLRFCFARERRELEGALDSLRGLFA
jgi:aspartate aminotransferase